jgi:hypothetical protein
MLEHVFARTVEYVRNRAPTILDVPDRVFKTEAKRFVRYWDKRLFTLCCSTHNETNVSQEHTCTLGIFYSFHDLSEGGGMNYCI